MRLIRLPSILSVQPVAILLATFVGIGCLLPAGQTLAAGSTEAAAVTVTKGGNGKISKEQATQSALAALPGTVTDATVEKKRGKNVWVIEIAAAKDGAETDVLVDMDSGTVIGMDH